MVFGLLCTVGWSRPQPVLFTPDDSRIGYMGAFDRRALEAPRFAWPGTQVRVSFTGRWLRVHLTDTAMRDETPENDWLDVEVDGQRHRPLRLKEGRHAYWIAIHLDARKLHTVVLTKRTEAEVGTVTLHAVEVAPGGELHPDAGNLLRHIEVIGDSISAGYGIEGTRGTCRARAINQDATRTYAAIAARELSAAWAIKAWSGKGVLRNYDARDPDTMGSLFRRSIPTDPESPDDLSAAADLVVIHLGTNDLWAGIPDQTAFLAAYGELLADVTARHPKTEVALVLSPLVTEEYPHPGARSTLARWLTVLKAQREARGQITPVIEQTLAPSEGLGCVAHPSLTSQARLGRELAEAIRLHFDW